MSFLKIKSRVTRYKVSSHMNDKWTQIPTQKIIDKTINALRQNGIHAEFVKTGSEAKEKVLSMIPEGAEVMTMTSVTLQTIGITEVIDESGKFNSVRKKLTSMDRATQSLEMQKLGAAPDWVVGSVHAVTQDGKVMIASNTGSQLSAYAYAGSHVIWVVGVQKIVENFDEGMKRIYEHSLVLERERAKKAYGIESNVNKILVINKEIKPDRISVILVGEVLGF